MRPAFRSVLALASLSCAALPLQALGQSLSTEFTGSLISTSTSGAGAFFSITALHPDGITIDRLDSHAQSGTVNIGYLYRPGTYVGFENDVTQWLAMGDARGTSGGTGNPTVLPNAGTVYIPAGETYSFRSVQVSGTARFSTEAQLGTATTISNADLQIDRGSVQTGSYFNSTPSAPRGWNGVVNYTVGGATPLGACCLLDGSCVSLRENICRLQAGKYQGNASTCAAVPGGCIQPAPGACCLADGSCSVTDAASCQSQIGFFNGYATACGPSACQSLGTPFDGITSSSGIYSGHFLDIVSLGDPLRITGFDLQTASTGASMVVRVYVKDGSWVGFADQGTSESWTVHSEQRVTAAGPGNPTRVNFPVGREIRIAAGATKGIRVATAGATLRYNGGATAFIPSVENASARIVYGAAQSAPWGTISANRHMAGNIYFTAEASTASGVCCRGATCTTTFSSAAACTGSFPSGSGAGAVFLTGSACNAAGNTMTPCCFADFDKVNDASIDDIFIYLNAWFASSPLAIAGGNGDSGTPSIDDIFIYLNAWFGGC